MGNVASQHYDGTRDFPRVDDTLVFARNISETRGILSNASARDGVSSARASVSPRATRVMCSNRLVRNFHPPRAARRLVSTPPRAFSGARSVRAFRADKEGAFPEPSSLDSDRNENSPKTLFFFFLAPNSNDCDRVYDGARAETYNKNHDIHSRPLDELMNHGEINHEHKMSRTPRSSMDNGRRGSIDESHARRSIDLSQQKSLPGKIYAVDVNVNRDMEDKMVSGLI